jgi:hypothetical protein
MGDPTLIRDLILAGVNADLVSRVAAAISGTPRKQTTLLPEDWKPQPHDVVALRNLGWRFEDIAVELQRFCDHARSNARRQADWDAAFRNWFRSDYQKRGPGHDKRSVLAAADKLAERIGGDARGYKPGTTGPGQLDFGAGPNGLRQLPKR